MLQCPDDTEDLASVGRKEYVTSLYKIRFYKIRFYKIRFYNNASISEPYFLLASREGSRLL
jgi:hypothetical protein